MTTAAATITDVGGDGYGKKVVWTLTTAVPIGDAVKFVQFADMCWQAVGTWGGATLTGQGSNDETNFFDMTNAAGAALQLTSDGGKQGTERPISLRPNLTVVGVGASVVVTLFLRKTQYK